MNNETQDWLCVRCVDWNLSTNIYNVVGVIKYGKRFLQLWFGINNFWSIKQSNLNDQVLSVKLFSFKEMVQEIYVKSWKFKQNIRMETVKKKLKENPRDRANIFSILVFSWVIPLFKEGAKKPLDTEDLFQSRNCDKSKVLAEKLQRFWDLQQNAKNGGASLLKALVKTFWREYAVLALLCLINDVILKIVQPQFLRKFLLYFKWVTFSS